MWCSTIANKLDVVKRIVSLMTLNSILINVQMGFCPTNYIRSYQLASYISNPTNLSGSPVSRAIDSIIIIWCTRDMKSSQKIRKLQLKLQKYSAQWGDSSSFIKFHSRLNILVHNKIYIRSHLAYIYCAPSWLPCLVRHWYFKLKWVQHCATRLAKSLSIL